jgi:hypothetical protein
MSIGYAEARNIVFLKIDIVAALFSHENHNSHQSVSFGSDLFGLRPEWISSFHSDASAQRSRGTVPRGESGAEREEAQGTHLAGKTIAFGTERLHHYMELQNRFFKFQKYG